MARSRPPSRQLQRQTKAAIRATVKASATTARASRREAERTVREAAYVARHYNRATVARIRETARSIELKAREDARAATRDRRLLAHFFTPAKRRTTYQRRVVGSVTRQVERGERPSAQSTVGRERARISSLSDAQAIEQFQRRLRQVFPNSENYENSFWRFDHLPDLARVMLPLSDNQLRILIVQREGADFNMELARMMRVQMAPVMVTKNPLHYHDSSRTDYGI